MGIRISQVDAFTNRRFAGNPAAVCVLSEAADEGWMQDVAREMNLSETAFARRLGAGSTIQPEVVHAHQGSGPLWSCDPGDRPYPVGRRPRAAWRNGEL